MKADALQSPGHGAAQAARAGAREARVPGPRPHLAALRTAYLELLKLCLCDLGGTSTGSVVALPDGTAAAKELRGDDLLLRSGGFDWPLDGLTMTGITRLDDLQTCVESVVADRVEGDLIEAGVWRGGASILMRATLDALGAEERTVWVADSFQGFPSRGEARREDPYMSAFEFLAAPLAEVKANFDRFGCERGVRFLPGFFDETLASLSGERWAVLRLDGDTYEATRLSLDCLYRDLSVGGYVIIDDYGALEECRRAVDEFRHEHGIEEPIEYVDWTCVRWRRQSDAPIAPGVSPPPAPERRSGPSSDSDRPRHARVPTHYELELRDHLALYRERLAAARAEIAAVRDWPVPVLKAWMRRKLSRSR